MEVKHIPEQDINGYSIIIPTRWTSRSLARLIESIKINSGLKHELIIVCDIFTSWQTYKYLQDNYLWYYQYDSCNYYKNCNYGASKATQEYLVFCQDDTIFAKNWDTNIKKHLNHKDYLTGKMIQGWQINNFFGMDSKDSKIEDFDIEKFNNYCVSIAQDTKNANLICDHPIFIAKDLFHKCKGFTDFTTHERVHNHHEHGLKVRVREAGGGGFGCGNSFIYHAPRTGMDKVWNYNYLTNSGYREPIEGDRNTKSLKPDFIPLSVKPRDTHYSVYCSKCNKPFEGRNLDKEELEIAEEKLNFICKECNE